MSFGLEVDVFHRESWGPRTIWELRQTWVACNSGSQGGGHSSGAGGVRNDGRCGYYGGAGGLRDGGHRRAGFCRGGDAGSIGRGH